MIPSHLTQSNTDCRGVADAFARQWHRLSELDVRVSQDPQELESLAGVIRALRCRSLLEIGSRNGGSLFLLAQALTAGSRVVGVDLPGGPWGGAGSEDDLARIGRELEDQGHTVGIVLGDSRSQLTIDKVRSAFPEGIDCAFIDGDHSYTGVHEDFNNYFPLVRDGGILALHDVWPRTDEPDIEVPAFWVQLMRDHRWDLFVARSNSPGIGVVWKNTLRSRLLGCLPP